MCTGFSACRRRDSSCGWAAACCNCLVWDAQQLVTVRIPTLQPSTLLLDCKLCSHGNQLLPVAAEGCTPLKLVVALPHDVTTQALPAGRWGYLA
jgi:hypothetical protein